jgi:hypothetical protein
VLLSVMIRPNADQPLCRHDDPDNTRHITDNSKALLTFVEKSE